jgi:hypothetical protein
MTFSMQIEIIKSDLLRRLGPAASIRILGSEKALPAAKTIRNLKSQGKIPTNVFFRCPSGILADTEKFLDWWVSHCNRA